MRGQPAFSKIASAFTWLMMTREERGGTATKHLWTRQRSSHLGRAVRQSPSLGQAAAALDSPTARLGHPPGEECREIIAFFGLGGGKSKQTGGERGREEGSRRRLSIVVTLLHTCFSGT